MWQEPYKMKEVLVATIEELRANLKASGLSVKAQEAALRVELKDNADLAKADVASKAAARQAALDSAWLPVQKALVGYADELLAKHGAGVKVLGDVGVKCFTIKYDKAQSERPIVGHEAVKASTGGAGGERVLTKHEYGLTLDEVYQRFKTPADDAAMVIAKAKDLELGGNGKAWNVKTAVKNRAVKDGKLTKPTG